MIQMINLLNAANFKVQSFQKYVYEENLSICIIKVQDDQRISPDFKIKYLYNKDR